MTGTDESTNQGTTRRTALKLFGGLAGVGGASALGLGAFSQSGRATVNDNSFTAEDVELSSDDGSVTDIWLRPDLTYSWDGLNSPPTGITFTVEAETPGGDYETLGSEDDGSVSGGTAGSDAYQFDNQCSLLDGAWTPGDFEPPQNETEKTGPIRVRVTAELRNGDGSSPYTDAAEAQFSVVVSDDEVEFGDGDGSGIDGEAGTGGSTGGGSNGDGGDGGNGDDGGSDGGNDGNGDGGGDDGNGDGGGDDGNDNDGTGNGKGNGNGNGGNGNNGNGNGGNNGNNGNGNGGNNGNGNDGA
ncbi:hypothetical protein [Halorussus litoreus]|uniref:hypothetical protein n=1 Tax=Halorussus litoreus TaxID=1710536 RepID=UPI0013007A9C|nr:hypothetical protein [Halorussus litoreus]